MNKEIEKSFVPFELAIELKEIGFDLPCIQYRWDPTYKHPEGIVPSNTPHWTVLSIINHNSLPTRVSIPLISQVFSWFRDNYGIWCEIISQIGLKSHGAKVLPYGNWFCHKVTTYEKCELECIKQLIKIIKYEQTNRL